MLDEPVGGSVKWLSLISAVILLSWLIFFTVDTNKYIDRIGYEIGSENSITPHSRAN